MRGTTVRNESGPGNRKYTRFSFGKYWQICIGLGHANGRGRTAGVRRWALEKRGTRGAEDCLFGGPVVV